MDKHTLAMISIIGSCFDVLSAMYLAYNLLGGEHGLLRTLTRAVTYGALFGAGFGLTLVGLTTGVAHGMTLAWEYSRASRRGPKPGFWLDTAMSAIRGCGIYSAGGLELDSAFSARWDRRSPIGFSHPADCSLPTCVHA